MMDLAYHRDKPHVHRHEIAKRQGIPADYMDQILVRLRRGEFISSVRGRGGGYRLAKPAATIDMWQLFSVVEDHFQPVMCQEEVRSCAYELSCVSKPAWDTIVDGIRSTLQNLTLEDLLHQTPALHEMCPVGGLRECRPGGTAKRKSAVDS